MKKITLLFTLMCAILTFGQETFEGAWPPPGWAIATGTNGIGAEEMWQPSQPGAYLGRNSQQAAFIDRVNIGQGNTEEDWLIMNQQTIPQDGQLRFWTRQTQSGNQNTIYQIRVSTDASQMNLGAYAIVKSYTEAELTDLNGDLTQYTEKFINFEAAYFSDQVYIAFVRVVTQTGPAAAGDRWLIDDVSIVQRCVDPDVLDVPSATIQATSAVLTWSNNSISTAFEVEVLPASEIPTGVANFSGTGESVNATGLQPGALMQFYVRSMCAGAPSEWVGPFFFQTLPLGSICSDPISVGVLPYQALGVNTGNYGDEVDPVQGSACGAVPAGTNYLAGHEIFYSYTAAANGVVSITMTPGAGENSTSLFVYQGCANVGVTCLAGVANSNASVRSLILNVVAGQTYIIVVSSAATNQTAVFDILIQSEDCTPKPTDLGVVPGSQTTSSAQLTWTSPGITSWEVAVQPLGSTVPQGPGTYYNGNLPYLANGLIAGNQYQYWVRSECGVGSDVFSAWAGPFPINPLLCNAADKCGYVFRLTDTGGNGWQGNTLTVLQNGVPVVLEINNNVEVTTIGQTFTSGQGPHDVLVPLCPGYPYEIFWNNGGTNPNQIRFEVINPFGQVEFAKTTASTTRNITLYTSNVAVNCTAPNCTIPPSAVATSNITTTGFTLNWAAPSVAMAGTFTWDIFIVPAGSGVPSAFAVPTYDNITVADPLNPSFVTLNPLLPDTCYEVYIRVNCEPNNSAFSTMVAVCTLPTCFKPVIVPATAVTDITLNGATFTWTKGSPTDTQWEILLVEGPGEPPTTPVVGDGTLYTYTSNDPNPIVTFSVSDLDPAQIYYFFVRTVCPGDDNSTWTGPVKFNTITCADADKCNYKFVLTDAGSNGWNGGRMQVRQNGIVVFDLVMTSGSSITRTVPLCDGVPFDVYWSVEGTQPQDIGFSIQNPFLDVLYTYVPGSGAPLSVVYSSTGANCTDNPCAKPTGITAEVTSATTATLSWIDNSAPDASTAFDVYIVETGGAAPINDPATVPTHVGVSNPFFITGLDPSTSYTFYVRAQCGNAQFSTWTVLTPITFITEPANDECIDAITVTVNSGQSCLAANNAPGNTLGATVSAPVLDPPLTGTGCLVNNRDVWYKFVASHTSHTISLLDIEVTPVSAQNSFKLNYSVFSGECTDLEKIACYTTTSGVITGLTVGEEYFIRVYPASNTASQSAEFKLCITSPPVNDECANAPTVQVNPEWSCSPALYTSGNTLGASPSAPTVTGTGCGTTDDDVWFKFTATSAIHVISLNNIVGSSTSVSLNHGLYSGPCDALVKIYCSTNNESVATNLTIGVVYYVRVYTAASTAGASATFDLCINTPPAPGPNDECVNAIPVPVNPDSKCLLRTYGNLIGATASGGNTSCVGSEDDDVWFSFVALSPRHIISLQNVVGTTTDLNHAVYQGSCGALVQKYCSTAGTLQSVSAANAFVIGQTYYVRVWSNSAVSQVVAFDICIKSVSTCENAESFCGSSSEDPFIYENTIGIPDSTQVACLGSIPNPTFYTLHVGQTGPLMFTLYQAGAFDANGNPVGPTRDVDYVAWGPFTTPESCNEISFTDCPTCPFSNVGSNFYPFGNIVDCSYSASFTETLSIPNAQEGEFYIILVTNFSNQPGYIRLVQTNFSAPNAGTTICCDVDLGEDITVCAESVEINALLEMDPSAPIPDEYEWFLNGSLTPIPGATSATLTVTESGTYKVKALCGLNSVSDEIVVTLGPVIEVDTPADYVQCEAVPGDGFATFNLASLTAQLGLDDLSLYEITFHTTAASAADKDAPGFDVTTPGSYATQTIYIRVESISLNTCYTVVPVNLVVSELASPAFTYDATAYCKNAPADPVITITGVAGAFTSTPEGLSIDPATGAISLAGSAPGEYVVTNLILGTGENQCSDISASFTITITAPLVATFDYAEFYCSDAANPSPTMGEGATIGLFTSDPAGLSIDPATGVINIAASALGTYTIYNTHPAANGCAEVVEQDIVTITELLDATFTYSSGQYCTDDANPVPVFTTGAAGVFSADSAGIALDPVTGEINLAASSAGTYIISNSFSAGNGCDAVTETFTVQINSPATADFSYTKATYCQDEGTALPNFGAGSIAGMFTATPTGLSINSATGEINLGASSAGTYAVTNMANATGACPSAIFTFSVTITAPYTGIISYNGGAFCKSATSEMITNTAPAGGTYDADGGLSINTATGEINPSMSTAGTYEVAYMLPANGGCGPFETVTTVTIYPESSVAFEAQCISTDYTVKAVAGNDSFDPATATYSWTTSTGSIKPGTANLQTVIVLSPGVYTVTVTTPDGCSTTEDHNVTTVRCQFQKGISPDGNGENDSFDLTGYNVKHISIFNRWGTMVFQWDNYTNQWSGQDNTGDELPDGTYFFVIDTGGREESGWIYLNR